MNSLTILDNIRIASPCPADWSEMAGDDRSRLCSSCSKQVHNISAMTAEEATGLILEREGRLCIQIYRRRDGTVITADCPVGLRAKARRKLRRFLAVSALVPALLLAGLTGAGIGRRRIQSFPTGPFTTWDDRVHWAMVTLGLRQPLPAKGLLEDVIYFSRGPEFPFANQQAAAEQAKLQRQRMRQAGIPLPPVPELPTNPPDESCPALITPNLSPSRVDCEASDKPKM